MVRKIVDEINGCCRVLQGFKNGSNSHLRFHRERDVDAINLEAIYLIRDIFEPTQQREIWARRYTLWHTILKKSMYIDSKPRVISKATSKLDIGLIDCDKEHRYTLATPKKA